MLSIYKGSGNDPDPDPDPAKGGLFGNCVKCFLFLSKKDQKDSFVDQIANQ